MFQSGRQTIGNSVSTVTVSFPQAFTAAPALVLPVMRNTVDASPLTPSVTVTTVTASSFTVKLSASTNSTHYELVWMAGDEKATLAIFSSLAGRSLTSYTPNGDMRSPFLLPFLSTTPTPVMKPVSADAFWQAVPQIAPAPPSFAGDAVNAPLSMYVDESGGYLYLSGGTKWLRTAIDASGNWSASSFFVPFREGTTTLTPSGSDTEYTISFNEAFTSGNAPNVAFSLLIPTGVSGPSVVHAMLKDTPTLTGFTLLFNAPLAHNVQVQYMARQLRGSFGGGAPTVALESPALTGTPTAPTASPGTNTTQIATTAFVSAAVTALVNAAPGLLNTLDELAAALGDDPNFATTVLAAIAGKADLAHSHSNATTVAAGFMSAADKTKLDGIAPSANNYVLLAPTTTVIGGVKRNTGTAGQFVKGISSDGSLQYDTPAGGGASITTPKVLHVTTAGNDTTGDGSLGAPFLTVDKALAVGVASFGIDTPFTVCMGVGAYYSTRANALAWPGAVTLQGAGADVTSLTMQCNRDLVMRCYAHSFALYLAGGGLDGSTPFQAGPGDAGIIGETGGQGPTLTVIDGAGSGVTSKGGRGGNGGQGGNANTEGGNGADGGQGGNGGAGGLVQLINSLFTGTVGSLPGDAGDGGPGGDGDIAMGGSNGGYGPGGNAGEAGAVNLLKSHAGAVVADQLYWGCSNVSDMSNVANVGSDYGGNSQMPYPSY